MVNLHCNWQASVGFTPKETSSTTASSQTLADEISQAFAQTLQQLGIDPSSIKLTLDTGSGQINELGQKVVSTPTIPVAPNIPLAPSHLGFNALVPTTPTVVPTPVASTVVSTPAYSSGSIFKHWYADNAADDAYWSKQPAPVQQLREIRSMQQREELAGQLASQGYQIDNTVMVWGWDAGQVTAERQADGYTWVPAGNQSAVTAAPGLTGPGMTPYDPANPPVGSILV